MGRKGNATIRILTLLVLWVSPLPLFAQTAKPPSLKEQLEAQYQQPGMVLVVQKAGILGVPSTSKTTCAARYQDHKLNTPDASCRAPLKNSSKPLTVGEKVNLLKIEVDEAKGKLSFRIGECDSCNNVAFSSLTSQIDFQFADLKKASVPEIEDTISEVLVFQEVAVEQPPQPLSPPDQPGDQTPGVLTNNDIVKMARVKLGDGIIISKIKASPPNFDMSVNALVKLKEAGVSDAVIQAMNDAQAAPPGPTPDGNNGLDVSGHWFVGGWRNEDVNTRSITRVEVTSAADALFVHMWGKCHPQDCDWGQNTADVSEATKGILKVTWVLSFATRTQQITILPDGRMQVAGHTHFTDNSGRQDRDSVDHFVHDVSPAATSANDSGGAYQQTEPSAAAPAPGQVTFSVRHRHSNAAGWFVQGAQTEYYCSGTLSVSSDGTVAYDCSQTDDPSGRCEHISFTRGTLKQAKIGLAGHLHLESKTQGKFHFLGDKNDIKQALAAIAPLIQTSQK